MPIDKELKNIIKTAIGVNYKPSSFALLRSAVLSYSVLEKIIEKDEKEVWAYIKEFVSNPLIESAIYIASPSLHSRLKTWEPNDTTKKAIKIRSTIFCYLSRMCYRATPFGLFAGVTRVGENKSKEELNLSKYENWSIHVELDMEILSTAIHILSLDEKIWKESSLVCNQSLYRLGNQYRYRKIYYEEIGVSNYQICEFSIIERDINLTFILKKIKKGTTGEKLIKDLMLKFKLKKHESERYVSSLIREQVIVIEPLKLTGNSPCEDFIKRFLKFNNEVVSSIQKAKKEVSKYTFSSIKALSSRFKDASEELSSITQSKDKFNIILNKTDNIFLKSSTYQEIVKAAEIFLSLTSVKRNDLETFKSAFLSRFQDSEIPLVEALDPISGVQWDSPEKITPEVLKKISGQESSLNDSKYVINNHSKNLIELIEKAKLLGKNEIYLNNKDLKHLCPSKENQGKAPISMSVLLSFGSEEKSGKRQYWIKSLSTSNAIKALTRFSVCDQKLAKDIKDFKKEVDDLEENIINAEIVHLPDDRIGNVILRPYLGGYEIPFFGGSSAPKELQIPIDDLLISVTNSKVFIRSKKLNKIIKPSLSNTHNYNFSGNINIYKFLCLLETQDTMLGGTLLSAEIYKLFSFIPRICYKSIVLHPATWILSKRDVLILRNLKHTKRCDFLRELQTARKMPDTLLIKLGDNMLPVFFYSNISILSVWEHLTKNKTTTLVEPVSRKGQHQSSILQEKQNVAHELIVPLVIKNKPEKKKEKSLEQASILNSSRKTIFLPGSEWLYFKMYGSEIILESIFISKITPVLTKLKEENIIVNWFFIRFNDPLEHIRVRIQTTYKNALSRVWPLIYQTIDKLVNAAEISSVIIDSYQRELSRYGGYQGIELSEKWFGLDSSRTVDIICLSLKPEIRWLVSIKVVLNIFNLLNLDSPECFRIVTNIADRYRKEFKVEKTNKNYFGLLYKKHLWVFNDTLKCEKKGWLSLELILNKYSLMEKEILSQVQEKCKNNLIKQNLSDLLVSYIHMHINRLMAGSPRKYEWLIYELLYRHYNSIRKKANLIKPRID